MSLDLIGFFLQSFPFLLLKIVIYRIEKPLFLLNIKCFGSTLVAIFLKIIFFSPLFTLYFECNFPNTKFIISVFKNGDLSSTEFAILNLSFLAKISSGKKLLKSWMHAL